MEGIVFSRHIESLILLDAGSELIFDGIMVQMGNDWEALGNPVNQLFPAGDNII